MEAAANQAPKAWRGRFYEDLEVGDVYRSRLGRTVTETDNVWFTCLTLNTNQNHFNDEFSKGTPFGRPLVNSAFTLALVTGLTVPDTSENATANLAWTDITMPNPVYVGDTLWAETEVLDTRESAVAPERRDHRRPHARDQPAPRGGHRVPPHVHGVQARSTRGRRPLPRDRHGLERLR